MVGSGPEVAVQVKMTIEMLNEACRALLLSDCVGLDRIYELKSFMYLLTVL